MQQTILLTGAAGIVGTLLRPLLRDRYDHVLLTDLVDVEPVGPRESFTACDITERQQLAQLASQATGIVHLAGRVGADYSFDDVLGPNIAGTYNIYQAAYEAKISHVVYASSHHAIGFIPRGMPIDHNTPHRPDSHYGLSKAFGESAGSYFADKFGINILAIRIGYVGDHVTDERRRHTWISPRDLTQLIAIGLSDRVQGYETVYGTSDNDPSFFDNGNATRLGYRPQDQANNHLANPEIADQKADPRSIAGACVGGGFAEVGFSGKVDRFISR